MSLRNLTDVVSCSLSSGFQLRRFVPVSSCPHQLERCSQFPDARESPSAPEAMNAGRNFLGASRTRPARHIDAPVSSYSRGKPLQAGVRQMELGDEGSVGAGGMDAGQWVDSSSLHRWEGVWTEPSVHINSFDLFSGTIEFAGLEGQTCGLSLGLGAGYRGEEGLVGSDMV